MATARDDILGVEAAAELLVRGLNRADISSLADLVTDATMVLPPARRTAKGEAAIECWRILAMGNEGIAILSTDMDTIAEGLVRDVGTLSMRQKQSGERNLFRYMMLWQKSGSAWTLATMTWNREAPAGGRRGSRPGGGAQDGGGG